MEQVYFSFNLDGAMAKAYYELLKELWNGNNNFLSPWDFRQIFIRFAKQVRIKVKLSLQGILSKTPMRCLHLFLMVYMKILIE